MLVGQRFKRRLDFFISAAEIALKLVTFLFSLLIPHGVKHGFQPAQFAHVRVQEALIDCISTDLVTNSNMFFYRLTLVSKPVNKRLVIVVVLGVTDKSNNS